MVNYEYINKNGDLDDEEILKALYKLPEMYIDGELSEVCDVIIDILNAITYWEHKW